MMLSTSGSSAVAARMVVFPSTQLFRAFWACQVQTVRIIQTDIPLSLTFLASCPLLYLTRAIP